MKTYIATVYPSFPDATCRHHDTNIWFEPDRQPEAIAICQTCPEQQACLAYAVTLPIDTEGIYAGRTQQQLVQLRRANNNPTPIKHGTNSGYAQHLRYGITPCDECRKANADYHRQRRNNVKNKPSAERERYIVHGTHSGAVQHGQYGVPMCEPCRAAKREYMREWNRRKRAKQREAAQ